jgi:hypothetical protein
MDNTELKNGRPAKPDKLPEKGGSSADRRSFIIGMAAGTIAAGSLGAAITGIAEPAIATEVKSLTCTDNPFTIFARAIVREVPLKQVAGYLNALGTLGPVAFGEACGNGCGNGCGNNCLRPIDPYGYTELTLQQLNAIVADKTTLRRELTTQIQQLSQNL